MNKIDLTDAEFHQMPADGGQIVSVTYAIVDEMLVRRSYDRSDCTASIQLAEIEDGEFEPWNGILPDHGEWVDA